ncbi:hypothetical protein, partial [Desulfosarcina sp.]|uniref:hypothetical protein n=1 Tax=Desulfosarcina sp. TaxID=2027861 RepID=UPI003970C196
RLGVSFCARAGESIFTVCEKSIGLYPVSPLQPMPTVHIKQAMKYFFVTSWHPQPYPFFSLKSSLFDPRNDLNPAVACRQYIKDLVVKSNSFQFFRKIFT